MMLISRVRVKLIIVKCLFIILPILVYLHCFIYNLNYLRMIEVSVYLSNSDFVNNKRKLCERVNCDSISMPYDDLKRAFRFLFGQGCIIQTVEML